MRSPCTVEDCEKPNTSRGLCDKHYRRFRLYGDPLGSAYTGQSECTVEGCAAIARARGWCNKHYQVWKNHGDATYRRPTAQTSPCTIDDCTNLVHSKGLCAMHYRRNRLHGDPLKAWVMRGEVCRIDGCMDPIAGHKLCSKHYQRWVNNGDPNYERPASRGVNIPHGTLTGYGFHACRCVECSAVQATASRTNMLKSKYGITPEDYDRMFAEQGGVCAICRRDGSAVMHKKLMAVDHDHITGQVRGLLCSPCNTSIGHMQDDPDRLMAAAAYLLQNTDVLGATA